ncbi:MAG: hypothetical protein Q9195_005517 [Heterodermia aff. obscurata]
MPRWLVLLTISFIYNSLVATSPLFITNSANVHPASDKTALTPVILAGHAINHPALSNEASLSRRGIYPMFITHSFMRNPFTNAPAWILKLRLASAILPAQVAAAALETFYDRLLDQVRLEAANSPYNALALEYGGIKLELRSADPSNNIPFGMLHDLLMEMRALTGRALVGTYEGEVVSAWTGWSILIRLKIKESA